MKTINEVTLINEIINYYNSPERNDEVIVIPIDHTGKIRWYITKEKNGMSRFLEDQPNLLRLIENNNISMDTVKHNIEEMENNSIGSWLKFIPGDKLSGDILTENYEIQPYLLNSPSDVIELVQDLFYENINNPFLYSGPLHLNDKTKELMCCYYTISKKELEEDISKFRENNGEYVSSFDELDYKL